MAKAKFDIKTEAARPILAGVGVTDLAVERVRGYVADVQKKFAGVQKDVQKSVNDLDFQPQALREQAVTVVNARVDALSKDAKARRTAIEARVAELQAEAKAYPAKVQALLNDNVASYDELVKRGETLVGRIRRQESTKRTASSAKTTTAKAKTTTTQAKKTAAKTTSTAKKTAKKSPAKSSAKATATAAKKTAAGAANAATDAAAKVGD